MIRILLCLLIVRGYANLFSQSDGSKDENALAIALLKLLEAKLSGSDCPAPSKPESGNGYFHYEEEKCYLECDPGYVSDGRSTTTCSEGSWAPSLNEMTCSPAFVLVAGGLYNSSTVEVFGKGFHKRIPNMPHPRMGHEVENVDGHLILCGGIPMEFAVYFPMPPPQKECIELDDEFKWNHYPDTHIGRDIHSSVGIHGTIYWIGGHSSPDTWEYNSPEGPNKDEWTMEYNFGVESDPYKFKHACAAKISPTEFLVTGGFYDAKLTLKYNVVTGELTKMESMNLCRSGHGCSYIKDEALGIEGVIVGGGYPLCNEEELAKQKKHVSFALTSSSEFYDLKTGKWRQVGDMSVEKRGMRMIYAQGAIHAFGGMSRIIDDDPTNNIQLNKDGFTNVLAFHFGRYVDKYDPVTETWSWTEEMLFGRNFHALTLISERKFYFGCLAPITPEHGKFSCPVYPEINEEKKCTLECDPGYAPNGGSTSICSEGSWAPSLTEMTCSPSSAEEAGVSIENLLAEILKRLSADDDDDDDN